MKHYLTLILLTLCTMLSAKDYIVVLDAGHGGKDPGAIGSSKSNREKDINLGITLEVGRLLKANCPDVKLIYTRDKDYFVELDRRAEIANKANADLFVSIHTNALPSNHSMMGVQTYALTLRTADENLEVEKRENSVIALEGSGAQSKYKFDNSPEAQLMFEMMQADRMKESAAFGKIVQNEMVRSAGRSNKGVRQANLLVLRKTTMPSVLLEVGFISTPSEERFLLSSSGQAMLARSIYNAIVRYKAQQTGRQSQLLTIDTKPAANTSTDEARATRAEQPQQDNTKVEQNQGNSNASSVNDDRPVFKVQILASTVQLKSNDRQFKGLTTEEYHDGKFYKYSHGNTTDYEEAKTIMRTVNKLFPGAYVVAFMNGHPIDKQEAIRMSKAKK